MTKEDDYRKNAAETVDLAHRATSTIDKGRLLCLAELGLILQIALTELHGQAIAQASGAPVA
jgi:hypothetical protein